MQMKAMISLRVGVDMGRVGMGHVQGIASVSVQFPFYLLEITFLSCWSN